MENNNNRKSTNTKCGAVLLWAAQNGHHKITKMFICAGGEVNTTDSNGRTLLHKAARCGHNKIVQILISSGADINITDVDGRTALHWAGIKGHNSVIQTLKAAKVDVNIIEKIGRTALHWAAHGGYNGVVQTLIGMQADVNTTDADGTTALHLAALNGHSNVVQTLLVAQAAINTVGSEGWTALHLAAHKGHNSIVQTLISAGAEVNATNSKGWTALQQASRWGHNKVVQTLIAGQAGVNTAGSDGRTALHRAARCEHNNVVQTLIAVGADVNTTDSDGSRALHLAAQEGHINVVQSLVATRADINNTDSKGRTALHWAAQKGHSSVVQTLIAAHADVNISDSYGRTALHLAAIFTQNRAAQILMGALTVKEKEEHLLRAAQHGIIMGLRYLIEAEVNLYATNNDGKIALQLALENDDKNVVQILAPHMICHKTLHHACRVGDEKLLSWFLQVSNIDMVDTNGQTALHVAIKSNKHKIATMLLARSADPLKQDNQGKTPLDLIKKETINEEMQEYLFCAAHHGLQEVMKFVIAAGMDLFATNKDRQIALELALQSNHTDVIQVLVPHMTHYKTLHHACRVGNEKLLDWFVEHSPNFNIGIPDTDGQTALHMAVKSNHHKIATWLLARSADPLEQDNQGKTALDLAREGKDAEMVKELEKASNEKKCNCLILDKKIIEQFRNNSVILKRNIYPLSEYKSHPFYGPVKHTEMTHAIHQEVHKMVNDIVDYMATTDWGRDLGLNNPTYIAVGSSREGTKIQKPNEYDFLVVFEAGKSLKSTDKICHLLLCPPGFAFLTSQDYSSDTRHLRSEELSKKALEQIISSSHLHELFWQQLNKIFSNLYQNSSDHKHLKLKLNPQRGFLESKACSTVTFTWTGDHFNGMDIEVDLTLALRFNIECPFLCPDGKVPDHFYLVPKPPHKDSLLGLAYGDDVREALWKVDFVPLESEMIATLPQHIKDAYITCKCIRALVPPVKVLGEITGADKFVSSFMMKLILLQEKDNFMRSHLSLEKLVLTLFDKLVRYLEDQYLPDTWSFRIPYSETLQQVEDCHLTSYGKSDVLVGSKRDIKHCLQVAQLLRFITQQLIDYDRVIKKGIQQEGYCTYATLRVYEACSEGDVELAEKLLNCGAVFNIPNDQGSTPLDLARAAGHTDMVRWLVDEGSNC